MKASSPRRFASVLPWLGIVVQVLPFILNAIRRKVPADVVSTDQLEAKNVKKRISRRTQEVS